ncbi:MAG: hypothetical protein AAF403_02240, partial [Pseudomonadota bacterium]
KFKSQNLELAINGLSLLMNRETIDEYKVLAILSMAERYAMIDLGMSICDQWLSRNEPTDSVCRYLGCFYMQYFQVDKAHRFFKQAFEINPTVGINLYNFGITERWMGDEIKAIELLRKSIEVSPDAHIYGHSLGVVLLQKGDFSAGFKQYEERLKVPFYQAHSYHLDAPFWEMQDLDGESVLIFSDQGIGDFIHFGRYLPSLCNVLKEKNVGRIYVWVYDSLQNIFSYNFAHLPIEWLSYETYHELIENHKNLDYKHLICSTSIGFYTALGAQKGQRIESKPFLKATPPSLLKWRTKINQLAQKNKPKVGLFWQGAVRHNSIDLLSIDKARSIDFKLLQPILDIKNVNFFALQYQNRLKNTPHVAEGSSWIDVMDAVHDFDDSAAILSQLDILISVDASIVHMAGALGVPVWMFNRWTTCWRWQRQGIHARWYNNFNIIRQSEYHDWDMPIAYVVKNLQAITANHKFMSAPDKS